MSQPVIQNIYYTQKLPSRAIAIAKLSTPPATPANLTDINSTPFTPASAVANANLSVWKNNVPNTGTPDFPGSAVGQILTISGETTYSIDNPFFEVTNIVSTGTPLFYQHPVGPGVTAAIILDLVGNQVTPTLLIQSGYVYHSMDGAAYQIQYANNSGYVITELLHYDPAMGESPYAPSATQYTFVGRLLAFNTTGNLYLRFTDTCAFQAMPLYTSLPNVPWYPRIRFDLQTAVPEWAQQIFLPAQPYIQANYVPGTVLSTSIIEFERKNIYLNSAYLPDILVYDSNYNLKYAIEGTTPGSAPRRGNEFPWARGLISGIDYTNARIQVQVTLDPTDIVYGFYSYYEPDLLLTAIDMNPATNALVKDKIVEFYYKNDGISAFQTIYYQIIDPITGDPISGKTNDTSPTTGTNHIFAQVMVGANFPASSITAIDSRVRGGGLGPLYQTIPEADSCWDLGYLDGRPYPINGTLAVYLPVGILNTLAKTDVYQLVMSCLPAGALPVIRYYDNLGNESL